MIKAGAVELVNADAAGFEPPPGNLLCYFYDPFGPPTIDAVGRRLAAHADRGRVVVVYVEPKHRAAFTRTGAFVILDDTPPILTLAVPA